MSKVKFLLLSMVVIALSCCTTVKETPKEPEKPQENVTANEHKPSVVAAPVKEEGVVAIKETLPSETTLSLQKMNISNDYRMVYVQGGTYTMGNDEIGKNRVTVKGFYIGETEVTQALWKEIMGNNPSYYKGDNLPVENVSWNECQEFIKKLNAKTGKKFRLPTESEWEFAARGGIQTKGYKYAGSNTVDDVSWYFDNSGSKERSEGSKTHPVKSKQANELGLYDMSGNVWEFCSDLYQERVANQVVKNGSYIVKGGSWYRNAPSSDVSFHYYLNPDVKNITVGLRLVMER